MFRRRFADALANPKWVAGTLLPPKSFGGPGFRKSGANAYGGARNFSAPRIPVSPLAVSDEVSAKIGAQNAGIRGFWASKPGPRFWGYGSRVGRCRLYGRNSDCSPNSENPEIEISGHGRRVRGEVRNSVAPPFSTPPSAVPEGGFCENRGLKLGVLGGPAIARDSPAVCPNVGRFRGGPGRLGASPDSSREIREFGFRDIGITVRISRGGGSGITVRSRVPRSCCRQLRVGFRPKAGLKPGVKAGRPRIDVSERPLSHIGRPRSDLRICDSL